MIGPNSKKRKVEDGMKGKITQPAKRFRKQTTYQSSSDDDQETVQTPEAVSLQDPREARENFGNAAASSHTEDDTNLEADTDDVSNDSDHDSDSASGTEDDNPNLTRKRKRNDPDAFAISMSKILGSKLATSKKSDPVLSRSADAMRASKEFADQALERMAKSKLRAEKKDALDKGRVKDVLGAGTSFDAVHGLADGLSTQETMELEKRLRKTAQRGVVKLFNAVRSAQIKGEEAAREARAKGLVGQGRREERVNQMSKKGFLDLIAGGGRLKAGKIEEA